MIRTNVLTGVNQVAREQALTQAEVLETNLVEVSAHLGARPDHARWQGKIFQIDGESRLYKNLKEETRLGEPDGLLGINCRHFFRPYVPGDEKHFSKGELDELKETTVKYNGEEFDQYKAEQKMRSIERQMREEKKGLELMKKQTLTQAYQKQDIKNLTSLLKTLERKQE